MFKIIKDGTSLGMTEAPTYVRQAGNGCFVLCQEEEATGITYGGAVYHLLGREAIEGAERKGSPAMSISPMARRWRPWTA